VGEALALLGVSVASALVPLINLEVYLIGLSAIASDDRLWYLAAIGGFGQLLGKIVWYYLGANALRWGWVRKKVETPKAQAKLDLWQRRTRERPVLGAALLVVSGFSGFPPFAIVAVLAGQLRMNLVVFVVGTFISRTLRFAVFLYAGKEAFDLLPSLGF
jgi:membrane protein YqaA with SNARE-associated domain